MLVLAPQNVFAQQTTEPRLLYGTVYGANTGKPLLTTVTAVNCRHTESTTTGSDGSWQLNYLYGSVGRITFSAPGYETQTFDLTPNAQWFYAGGTVSLQPARSR
jgi:hypothetical protein